MIEPIVSTEVGMCAGMHAHTYTIKLLGLIFSSRTLMKGGEKNPLELFVLNIHSAECSITFSYWW